MSKLSTQEMVSLVGIAAATTAGVRRVVGVEATGINACPCAQGLVRGRAAERLAEAGYEDVDRILDLVPLATHNQRGKGSLYVGTERQLDATTWSTIVQGSMSAPIYELLKRPDELFVVEHAHLQPRFVEDSVRLSLKGALDAMPELADGDFLFARQINFETIHAHDVLAEREGTVGELRAELEPARRRRRSSTPRSRTGCGASRSEAVQRGRALRAASRKRLSVSGPQAARCSRRWSRTTPTAAIAPKTTIGHGSPSRTARTATRARPRSRPAMRSG